MASLLRWRAYPSIFEVYGEFGECLVTNDLKLNSEQGTGSPGKTREGHSIVTGISVG
jgi:hypothetical protein